MSMPSVGRSHFYPTDANYKKWVLKCQCPPSGAAISTHPTELVYANYACQCPQSGAAISTMGLMNNKVYDIRVNALSRAEPFLHNGNLL